MRASAASVWWCSLEQQRCEPTNDVPQSLVYCDSSCTTEGARCAQDGLYGTCATGCQRLGVPLACPAISDAARPTAADAALLCANATLPQACADRVMACAVTANPVADCAYRNAEISRGMQCQLEPVDCTLPENGEFDFFCSTTYN